MNSKSLTIAGFLAGLALVPTSQADMVTVWNAHIKQAVRIAAQAPPIQPRFASIVHAAIFDAVNGIGGILEDEFLL